MLGALAKSKQHSLAISFYKTLATCGVLGPRSDLTIVNILINCYSRMNLGSVAFSAFGLILKNGYCPDVITFNTLIKGLFLEKKVVEAVGLYTKMIQLGCSPDVITYSIMVDGLCKTENTATAFQLHREIVHGKTGIAKKSCKPNTTSHDVIYGGCMERLMSDTKEVDVRISPDVISYNCLIDGSGMEEDAKSLFAEIIDRGVRPNVVTYSILINLLCKKGNVEQAKQVMETMVHRGEFPTTITYGTILDGYCRFGKIEEALNLYKDMNCKGIIVSNVTLTTLLKGLFHVKKVEDALRLCNDMKKTDVNGGCTPNQVTYATVINGVCKEGHVGKAEELFLEMRASGICPNGYVYCSLIDGLCKQGHMGEAQALFLEMLAAGVSPK